MLIKSEFVSLQSGICKSIVTPKVKMTHRKALIVEILSEDDRSFWRVQCI